MITADVATEQLLGEESLVPEHLVLALPDAELVVHSNSMALLDELRRYFGHLLVSSASGVALDIIALERAVVSLDVEWLDWAREPGKTGRKDSYADIPGGRLIRKVRTGMVFWQGTSDRLGQRLAVGPCCRHLSQVINFINNQYMNWLQQQGWLICHAAALAAPDLGIAIAGLSGGGKSTLMLHLLEDERFGYVTNDRLFIRRDPMGLRARGIAKWPRINPGTILNNARLRSLLSEVEVEDFEGMSTEELWRVERKFDVDIAELYGEDRFAVDPVLRHFVILDWSLASEVPMTVSCLDPARDVEELTMVLPAIMKTSGPFYHDIDGRFHADTDVPDPDLYHAALADVQVHVARGRIDFAALTDYCGGLGA